MNLENTQTPQTTEDRIAELLSINKTDIEAITAMITVVEKPMDWVTAREVIRSDFATEEQKGAARKRWAELSLIEIEEAKNAATAELALDKCDFNYGQVVQKALEKFLALPPRSNDLTLSYRIGNIYSALNQAPESVRDELQALIRDHLITSAVTLKKMLKLWGICKCTTDEKRLLELSEGLLEAELQKEDKDATENLLCDIFLNTHGSNPMQYKVYEAWTKIIPQESGTRLFILVGTLQRINQGLEKLRASSKTSHESSQESGARNTEDEQLTKIQKDLAGRIDNLKHAALDETNDQDEDTLLATYKEADKNGFGRTKELALSKLNASWKKRLEESSSFDDALAVFRSMNQIYWNTSSATEDAWRALSTRAKDKYQMRQVMGMAGYIDRQVEAARSWIIYEPGFEEMLEVQKRVYGVPALDMALAKAANTLDDAIRLVGLSWANDEASMMAAKKLADQIRSFDDGIKVLNAMLARTFNTRLERLSILKEVLRWVNSEIQLIIVRKFLGAGLSNQEKRVLVEKAIEFIGQKKEELVTTQGS